LSDCALFALSNWVFDLFILNFTYIEIYVCFVCLSIFTSFLLSLLILILQNFLYPLVNHTLPLFFRSIFLVYGLFTILYFLFFSEFLIQV